MNRRNERLLKPSMSRQDAPTSEPAGSEAVASTAPMSRSTTGVPKMEEQVAPGLRAKMLAIAFRMNAENWRECSEQLEELAVGPERYALIKAVCASGDDDAYDLSSYTGSSAAAGGISDGKQ